MEFHLYKMFLHFPTPLWIITFLKCPLKCLEYSGVQAGLFEFKNVKMWLKSPSLSYRIIESSTLFRTFFCISHLHSQTVTSQYMVLYQRATMQSQSSAMLGNIPPISQTLSLNPSCINDLILKPWVGIICDMSSSDSYWNMFDKGRFRCNNEEEWNADTNGLAFASPSLRLVHLLQNSSFSWVIEA